MLSLCEVSEHISVSPSIMDSVTSCILRECMMLIVSAMTKITLFEMRQVGKTGLRYARISQSLVEVIE